VTGPIGRARWDDFLEQFQRDLPRPALRVKIFRCSSDPNQWLFPRCPVSTRGADRASSRTRDGMRWTQQRQARDVVRRAGFPVSGHGAQDDRRCSVRQNRVVLTPVAGAKLPVANSTQPDRSAIKPAAMEAKGIRLQGERDISRQPIARGMPECSGCTCMLVCAPLYTIARETAGAASTRHSLLPLV
jgi:hypothetical protein